MNQSELNKLAQDLVSTTPLLGGRKRRKAAERLAADSGPDSVPLLLQALGSTDEQVRQIAAAALASLQETEAVEALCREFLAGGSATAGEIIRSAGYQPKDVGARCLVFLLSGQTKRYLDLDYEFQHLKAQYQAADEGLKKRIGDLVRQSGDQRLVGIFGTAQRLKDPELLTLREAGIVIEVHAKNAQWLDLFRLLFVLPLGSLPKALKALQGSGWLPESEVEAQVLQDAIALLPLATSPPSRVLWGEQAMLVGPPLAEWLDSGFRARHLAMPEETLRKDLREGGTPQAAPALAALAAKGAIKDEDKKAAAEHVDWMVRFAARIMFAKGAAAPTPPGDGQELWPGRLFPLLQEGQMQGLRALELTPLDLEAIQALLERDTEAFDPERLPGLQILELLVRHNLRFAIDVQDGWEVMIEEDAIDIDE